MTHAHMPESKHKKVHLTAEQQTAVEDIRADFIDMPATDAVIAQLIGKISKYLRREVQYRRLPDDDIVVNAWVLLGDIVITIEYGATQPDESPAIDSQECRKLRGLLKEARSHVFRQIGHGKHEQDRADALDLYPRIQEELKE